MLYTEILKIRKWRFPEHRPQPTRKCPLTGAGGRSCFAKREAFAQPMSRPALEPLDQRVRMRKVIRDGENRL